MLNSIKFSLHLCPRIFHQNPTRVSFWVEAYDSHSADFIFDTLSGTIPENDVEYVLTMYISDRAGGEILNIPKKAVILNGKTIRDYESP
jgi:hypothetical protein